MKRAVVEEIKSRLTIVECIEQYIKVEKAGKNYKALCPFHSEKSASFYISTERDSYYCFGCGKKGDIFSFVQEYEGLDFKTTLKQLAEKTGVPLTDYSTVEQHGDSKKVLYSILEDATLFFVHNLNRTPSAVSYLQKRGVSPVTMETYRIGYAEDAWETLYLHLQKKGYTDKDIEDAGLIKMGQYKRYDRFRNRIMFPFMDTNGRVIGFSGRTIGTDPKEAKYINSPETILFNKGKVLFGLYQAKDAIRTQKKVVVVEGQMDVIMTYQSGMQAVVASSGTAFSGDTYDDQGFVSHLGIIKRFTDSIYLAFDNDKAGIKAMYKATLEALQTGFTVFCIEITGGKDMADIAREHPEKIQTLINTKQDAIMFFVSYLKNNTSERIFYKSISEKIWPLVLYIQSSIEQAHILSKIATLIGISEQTLLDDFKKYKTDNTHYTQMVPEKKKEINAVIDTLFGILFYLEHINDETNKVLFESKLRDILGEDYELQKEQFEIKKDELMFLVEKTYTDNVSLVKDSQFLFEAFERDFYRQKLERLKDELKSDELLGIDSSAKLEEVALITRKITQTRN
jgi:DNA primase